MRTRLTEGKIAAENGEAGCGEGVGESDQERSIAVCSRAVGQYEAITAAACRQMQEPANGYFARSVCEFLKVCHMRM